MTNFQGNNLSPSPILHTDYRNKNAVTVNKIQDSYDQFKKKLSNIKSNLIHFITD